MIPGRLRKAPENFIAQGDVPRVRETVEAGRYEE
jgi:hypothetical protein